MPEASRLPITWPALLAHFTGLAQRALALPDTPEGNRLRSAVPHVIGLQGVAHALDHLDRLPADERAVGLDRGEIIIRDHAGALNTLYRGEEMPGVLRACADDARRALEGARSIGLGWVVTAEALITEHPGQLGAALLGAGFGGDLMVPTPGVALFRTSPCAFVRGADGGVVEDGLLALIGMFLGQRERLSRGPMTARPVQVYRQFDFGKGGAVRDVVRALTADPVAGQPLLVRAIVAGEAQPVSLPPRNSGAVRAVPVVFEEE